MPEIDTSSYPKPAIPTSPLDVAGKLGGLQSQALQINQQKLDQANQALMYLTRGLNSLGPNATKDDLIKLGHGLVKDGLAPASMMQNMENDIRNTPDDKMPALIDRLNTQAAQHSEMMNHFRGQLYTNQSGQRTDVLRIPTSPNYPIKQQLSIPTEAPPTSEKVDLSSGQRGTIGNVPPPPAQGFNRLGAPVPLPAGAMDPSRIPGMRSAIGEKAISAEVMPAQNGSFPTAAAPGFEEGLKQRTEDQNLATQKMTAVKPLLLAYPKILDLRSGPGTQTWNSAVAFLKANNIIPTQANDPTAIYQEANKYFNQYISRNGSRSDAEQSAKEMSNPDIKTHINPALVELTRKTIAQDRIEAARPNAFQNQDFSKYGEHKSTFPQTMHIEAAHLDLLPPKERIKKFNDMLEKAKSGNKDAIKFIRTLDIMRRQNMHDNTIVTE